jgi:RimJ/RimL family protein N-acetyltransferase
VSPAVDTVERVGHIELRDLDDDDLDAIFEMMRDRAAVEMAAFTAADPDDRDAFDEWMARHRAAPEVTMFVVTEDGGFAGTAAVFSVEGDREVTYWIARHAWGRGVATEALRVLVSREPERPLFARVAAHNAASAAVLAKVGFTEVSRDVEFAPGIGRDVEEIVMVLVPTLE